MSLAFARSLRLVTSITAIALMTLSSGNAASADRMRDVEEAMHAGRWDDALEMAYEVLLKDPRASLPKIKAAYALFQKGYPNAALVLLRGLSADDWKKIPQGQDRFAEIVSLFQKKVPLDLLANRIEQLDAESASPFLREEIRFAQGRQAFERGAWKEAKTKLELIAKGSSYYIQARYMLGAMASRDGNSVLAKAEFSKVFEPAVYDQSGEFWNDFAAQLTSHWGANLKVMIDARAVGRSAKIGELSLLGLARTSYAARDFDSALDPYARIAPTSSFHARASLERIWTLLQLNRFDDAIAAANVLTSTGTNFESIEARIVRAITLTEAGKSAEARRELDAFDGVYQTTRKKLASYKGVSLSDDLPAFIETDVRENLQIGALSTYLESLGAEIKAIAQENSRLFPVYTYLGAELEPLVGQAKRQIEKLRTAHVAKRLKDLDQLRVQSHLVRAETFLEDREAMRRSFAKAGATPESQMELERNLTGALENAVREVDLVLERGDVRNPSLEFRQAELLWELGTAKTMLSMGTSDDAKQSAAAQQLKIRALKLASDVEAKYPSFEKRSSVAFFSGFAMLELGRIAVGVDKLLAFVNAYPRDEHAPDAYRILGDIRFDDNRFAEAETLYNKILQFPDSPILGYALYKIAWCGYNRRDFSKALLGLEKAINSTSNISEGSPILTLRREARRDLVAIYAEVGDHRKAREYFARFFVEDTSGWLRELAERLDSLGQFEKSRDLYHHLVRQEANAGDTTALRAKLIHGALQLQAWSVVLNETKALQEAAGASLTEPSKETPESKAELAVRQAALYQLFEFEKTQSTEIKTRAKELNLLYLAIFGAWPEARDVLYRHAKLLFFTGEIAASADAFRTHWLRYGAGLSEPLKEEALRNLIHTLEKKESALKPGEEYAAETADDLVKFAGEYLASYPTAKFARPIAFVRAATHFKHRRLDVGIAESQILFEIDPADDIGKRSFQNLRYAYYEKKDWAAAYAWASALATNKAPKLVPYQADLRSIREETLFLAAREANDADQAVKIYREIAAEPAFSRLKDKSLYNAFLRYEKADRRSEALKLADELERANPRFEGVRYARGVSAAFHSEAGDFARALPLLKRFLQEPDPSVEAKVLEQARFNAAGMAEALGDTKDALELVKPLLARAPAAIPATDIERLMNRLKRVPAAAAASEPKRWSLLQNERKDFERSPFPRHKDLAQRIQLGAAHLEDLAKRFLKFADASDVSAPLQLESFCSVPYLYDAFAKKLGLLAGDDAALGDELGKIARPIAEKAEELAGRCITKSSENLLDGENYRRAIARWGWRSNEAKSTKADQLLKLLAAKSPWLAPRIIGGSEAELLARHIASHRDANEDSWYALGLERLARGQRPLARLTFVTALGRWRDSSRLLHGLAAVAEAEGDRSAPALYAEAAKKGAAGAWLDLARWHLQHERLESAIDALKSALAAGALETEPESKRLAQELVI